MRYTKIYKQKMTRVSIWTVIYALHICIYGRADGQTCRQTAKLWPKTKFMALKSITTNVNKQQNNNEKALPDMEK